MNTVVPLESEDLVTGKVQIELGPVQKTLLLPLWGRAVESGKRRPRLLDETARRVVEELDFDFSSLASSMSEISRLSWIARSIAFDSFIRAFLKEHEGAAVVNIGCGLDTTFERVDDGKVRWFDLDLPDVIALREKLIPERPRRTMIASSVFDRGWEDIVGHSEPVFFLAAGVLYYFTAAQVRELTVRLVSSFPGCELAFDSASKAGVTIANKRVIEAGGMGSDAMLKWALEGPDDLAKWDPRIEVVSFRPMFQRFKRGLHVRAIVGTMVSDHYRIMSIVHIRGRASASA